MRESVRRDGGAGLPRVRRSLGRLLEAEPDAPLRYLALQDSARVGRSFALLAAATLGIAAGWGDRGLLATALACEVAGALLLSRASRELPAWQRRVALLSPGGWTLCLVVLAFAGRDPAGGFEAAPLLIASTAAAGSFGASLTARQALLWLGATAPLVWAAALVAGAPVSYAVLTPVAIFVSGTIAIAAALARREAELDRRDLTALGATIDPSATVATTAARIADSIAAWGIFEGVVLVGFETARSGVVLAKSVGGADLVPFEPGEPLPAPRVAYLRDRAERGPWIERVRSDSVVESGRQVRGAGDSAIAYVPILAALGPAALLVATGRGSGSQSAIARLADELPVLVDAAALAANALVPMLARRGREVEQREWLASVIANHRFGPVFQPVLDLASGQVVGYEALTRFADGTPPDRAFAHAERLGLGLWLEEATLAAAVEASDALPAGAWLSLNLSPAFLLSARPVPILAGQRRDVVLELTEHVAIDDYATLRAAVAGLGPNVRLAVDDAGAGFASLRHVVELEPQIVKLDLALVRGIDSDRSRQALLSSLCHFASKTNCRLLAEGIETAGELETVRALGIELGQGYLLGRPATVAAAGAPAPRDGGDGLADAA